ASQRRPGASDRRPSFSTWNVQGAFRTSGAVSRRSSGGRIYHRNYRWYEQERVRPGRGPSGPRSRPALPPVGPLGQEVAVMLTRSDRRRVLGLSIAALAGAALGAGCASQLAQPVATGAPATPAATDASTQRVTVSVVSAAMQIAKGSDGRFHDAFVPAFFVLQAARPVYLTIVN